MILTFSKKKKYQFLLQSALFSTLYPDNISLLLLQFILLPPLFIFFIFLGAGYIIVLKVLNDVAESSTNSRFAVRKVSILFYFLFHFLQKIKYIANK